MFALNVVFQPTMNKSIKGGMVGLVDKQMRVKSGRNMQIFALFPRIFVVDRPLKSNCVGLI